MKVTKEQLVDLANYLISLVEMSEEECIEIERSEFEQQLLYNPNREV